MTDRLRELFDDMLADEPPLRTSPDEAEAAGRRLRTRYRTLWTVAGAALAAVVLTVGPAVALPRTAPVTPAAQRTPGASPALSLADSVPGDPPTVPSPPSAAPSSALDSYQHCPADPAPYTVDNTDGSVLPDPDRAVAAVQSAAGKLAPGLKFMVNLSGLVLPAKGEKMAGIPYVYLVFDVGNDQGFGSLNLQLVPDKTGTAADRAESMLDSAGACVQVQRRDYLDGSVAISYPQGSPQQEAMVTQIWYFAQAGYTMNIGLFPQAWPTATDPNVPAIPSSLPALGHLPLSISQVTDLADVVAHST
jgi:hypothetical protein